MKATIAQGIVLAVAAGIWLGVEDDVSNEEQVLLLSCALLIALVSGAIASYKLTALVYKVLDGVEMPPEEKKVNPAYVLDPTTPRNDPKLAAQDFETEHSDLTSPTGPGLHKQPPAYAPGHGPEGVPQQIPHRVEAPFSPTS